MNAAMIRDLTLLTRSIVANLIDYDENAAPTTVASIRRRYADRSQHAPTFIHLDTFEAAARDAQLAGIEWTRKTREANDMDRAYEESPSTETGAALAPADEARRHAELAWMKANECYLAERNSLIAELYAYAAQTFAKSSLSASVFAD